MKASIMQPSISDSEFKAVEIYMRMISGGISLSPNHNDYVICDNIRILAAESEQTFQDILVQVGEALIDHGQYLSMNRMFLYELVIDYYLQKFYTKDANSTVKTWISHHAKEIYARNKYRLAS